MVSVVNNDHGIQDGRVESVDAVFVGAGIMSAHLGTLLSILEPNWSLRFYEKADGPATESSDPWNNAGTGHAALCELNYTPQDARGNVDISKAIGVNEKFQLSRQWWTSAVKEGILDEPKDFINSVEHISFVHGADNIYYLKKRFEALRENTLFKGIEFSQDSEVFSQKLPLMAQGRDFSHPVAISWHKRGTDLNYGALTKKLFGYLGDKADISYGHQVVNVKPVGKNSSGWEVVVLNSRTGKKHTVRAKFVFLGAGGATLHLLQKSGIKEGKGLGGFPISGVFARCTNPEVIDQHSAKVYGKASVGAPPMSVPHLDTRVIDGKKGLLFGPYAGWSPKFLKQGSYLDLIKSVNPGNVVPMMSVGLSEFSLLKYLISELTKSFHGRIADLKQFYPQVNPEDWEMITAGQRVQLIRGSGFKGSLEFGTATVTSSDGSLAAILGASPGASIVVSAMLEILQKCFPEQYESRWKKTLSDMIPSLGTKLADNQSLFDSITAECSAVLKLEDTANS